MRNARRADWMSADKKIPKMTGYDQIGAFWDTYSIAEYWEQLKILSFDLVV